MAKKTNGGKRDALWAEAKRRCRLNQEDIRMAKEIGLNPRSLIKNIPAKSEPWKEPVKYWIREMYQKRQEKAAKKKARRTTTEEAVREGATVMPGVPGAGSFSSRRDVPATDCEYRQGEPPAGFAESPSADPFGNEEPWDVDPVGIAEESWRRTRKIRPSKQKIEEQDQYMLRRQRNFRLAADVVTAAFAQLPEVEKVVLFGSVAVPLKKEVPRFREFRRHGIAVWHECKDVDLAVWMRDLDHLRNLQKARSRALNELHQTQNVGVAHHQVEVFIMEPGTDRYVGRLCAFTRCPKDKLECLVPGCGDTPFLKQQKGFVFSKDALAAEKIITLFDRWHSLKEDKDVPLP